MTRVVEEKGHQGGTRTPSHEFVIGESPAQSRPSSAAKATILEVHGYRTGDTIGYGSYATVKDAYSQKHGMKVAIKIISKKRAPVDYLEKFLPREIEIIRKLKHPSLILNIQCIETNNRVYIVMESAVNGDLLKAVRTRKFIDEKTAALWFCQLADGVAHIHSIGVVHRDLKCENLLLDRNYNLKICDFGFARDGVIFSDGRFVLSETYCGSYAYAPPEILTGTPYAGHLADVWSSGVILYVMVFGSLPFEDSNHRELLRQVRRGPEFPTQADRQVSMLCKNIIKRILVKREMRSRMTTIRTDPWCKKYGPPLPEPPVAKSPPPTVPAVQPTAPPSQRPTTSERVREPAERSRQSAPQQSPQEQSAQQQSTQEQSTQQQSAQQQSAQQQSTQQQSAQQQSAQQQSTQTQEKEKPQEAPEKPQAGASKSNDREKSVDGYITAESSAVDL